MTNKGQSNVQTLEGCGGIENQRARHRHPFRDWKPLINIPDRYDVEHHAAKRFNVIGFVWIANRGEMGI